MGIYHTLMYIVGYDKEIRILLLGLKGSGKTTFLSGLPSDSSDRTRPQILNVETANYNNVKITSWDVEDTDKLHQRELMNVARDTGALVFFVNSCDKDGLTSAKEHLLKMLGAGVLRDAVLLVFANKQDQEGAMGIDEITDTLGLKELQNRKWHIQPSSLMTGEGIDQGFHWLGQALKSQKHLLPSYKRHESSDSDDDIDDFI